ncbi:MAG: DAK2 domain-containing protein [Anaerolineae bacterium]
MLTNKPLVTCNGVYLTRLALAGLAWLETNQEKVNQLNVFPVPDGDTGTNMFLTMRKACESLSTHNEAHVGRVCREIANGALLGARGNSGVILSQWWRGFAEALENHSEFDAQLFAQACRNAVERSYKAVVKPVEGTILTVTRQSMEAVIEKTRTETNLQAIFDAKVTAAYESLLHTPDLLPVLKDAGVVDSGGQGWTFIIEGMLKSMRGENIATRSPIQVQNELLDWEKALVPEDEEGYGYDVQFLMRGQGMDVDVIRSAISDIGWSALVVGDERLIKVHVHVHDPGVPISYAIKQGADLQDIVVENMQLQYQTYVVDRANREDNTSSVASADSVAVIAVAIGEGLRNLFIRDLGAAHVISGGQTMNPSTEDFVTVIESLPGTEIILLPNNPNVLLAAQQATTLVRDKKVQVVPSRTIPQGIAAMLEYGNERDKLDLPSLCTAMDKALKSVITCEVTTATRDATLDGVTVHVGQYIGLVDDKLRAAGETLEVITVEILHKAEADKRELITLYYGNEVTEELAQNLAAHLAEEFTEQEFQLVSGGQPLYPYIISVE